MAKKKEDLYFSSVEIKKLRKEYGADFCVPLSEIEDSDRGIIKTFPSLDSALGGGILRGTVTQIAGAPKIGKTTLAFNVAASFQKQYPDKEIFYYKVEGRLSSSLAKGIDGLDASRIKIIQSTKHKILSGLDFFVILEQNMRTFTDGLHIIDSVGAVAGEQELGNSMKDQQRGELAKILAKFCRRNSGVIPVTNSTVIALNHIRDDFNTKKKYSPGGRPWQHQVDIDIMLKKAFPDWKVLNGDKILVGHIVVAVVKTCPLGPPNGEASLDLIYGTGFSLLRDIVRLSVDLGIVEKAGAWFKFEDFTWQGENKYVLAMNEDKELYDKIYKLVCDLIYGGDNETPDA